jgi:ubiquinone/menaquinone biosynthesis C-methylase UbiE
MSFDPRRDYQDFEVAEQYDAERFSSLSGKVFQWAERRAIERIVASLPDKARVLDLPCGTGRLSDLLVRRGWKTIACDVSGEMLAVARKRSVQLGHSISFFRTDCLQMGVGEGAVSAVFSIRFLVHIAPEERVKMLREFRRVTERWVVMSMSLSTPWHRFRRRLKGWLGHPKPVRFPVTSRALGEELRLAGLREVRRVWTFPILSEQVLVVCERM